MADLAHFTALSKESVWSDKHTYDAVENKYYEMKSGTSSQISGENIAGKIKAVREKIQAACERQSGGKQHKVSNQDTSMDAMVQRMSEMEKKMEQLQITVNTLNSRLNEAVQQGFKVSGSTSTTVKPAPASKEEDDDSDVDLFGSDDEEEDAEAAKIREQRLAAYAEKKSKKAGPIAKSSVLLDVKPWSDETDLKQMEAEIREITMEGLTWGAAKSVPLAFGIHKLSILCTVEDEKVSIDDLSEKIEEIEEHVQSVDIAAFNKI